MTPRRFEHVARPEGRHESFRQAMLRTLHTGDAIAVALGNEPYTVVRNRKANGVYRLAKSLHARIRHCRSEDGTSVLLWLERIEDRAGTKKPAL